MPYNVPASPLDVTSFKSKAHRSVGFAPDLDEKNTHTATRSVRSNSDSSEGSSTPRRARFAEATSVISPVAGPDEKQGPFADPPTMTNNANSRPSDFGFGYISDNNPVEQHANVPTTLHAGGMPLKSALKTPGTAARLINPLSPTWAEEAMLEEEEEKTEKQQAKDLKVKTRVRIAKMALRGVNFSCSLIVLAMLSTTLTIFHSTRNIPKRNGLPAWSPTGTTWPQLVVLCIACISLFFSVVIIGAHCRHGHKRAQKMSLYYTMFAIGYFIFSIVMWMVGAAVLQGTKANSAGQDIWGWSCKQNKRNDLFKDDVHYALVCRLQDWSLICCIIEIVIEMFVIAIYAVVFYRFYSKHRLRKSMDARDKARSDLYLAQLRSQSAPNTPAYPRNAYFPSSTSDQKVDPYVTAEEGDYYAPPPTQTQPSSAATSAYTSTPFKLQAPPIKIHSATPKVAQDGFEASTPSSSTTPKERMNDHVEAAPGETVYESVPIPGAYAGAPTGHGHGTAY